MEHQQRRIKSSSSPLLQLFNNNNNNNGGERSPSPSLLRSLSKCFDGGVALEDVDNNDNNNVVAAAALLLNNDLEEQEADDADADAGVESNVNGIIIAGQQQQHHHQWGKTNSYQSDDYSNNNKQQKRNKSGTTFGFKNLFKPKSSPATATATATADPSSSPSKSSQANSSNKTDPTLQVTTSTSTFEMKEQQQQQHLSLKTGMSSAPATPGGMSSFGTQAGNTTANNTGTTGALGGNNSNYNYNTNNTGSSAAVINTFWNNHARPATCAASENTTVGAGGGIGGSGGCVVIPSDDGSPSSRYPNPASPLSTSARAAKDAVMGMFARAEEFVGSPSSGGGGFCGGHADGSPRAMEGIPEEETGGAANYDTNFCGVAGDGIGFGGDGGCFEFEEFGFNAFQEDGVRTEKSVAVVATTTSVERDYEAVHSAAQSEQPQPPPPQPKGYEIRLKSTFSQVKAQKELQKEKKGMAAAAAANLRQRASSPPFGRTHPNNNNHKPTMAMSNQQQHQQLQDMDINIISQVPTALRSRALPDGLPFRELSVPQEIVHSVSELTMRSHGAFDRAKHTSDSRRMAYYAVGRAAPVSNGGGNGGGKPSSSVGGNRRCYFTGMGIPYGMPFYAGSVQQGPRTLVVFCLPAALGLPKDGNGGGSSNTADNNRADRERYLESLPEPDSALLGEMSKRYPEPFDTLPVQVRSPHCWDLFVKFCFFSGLPIAEGELHYRVKGSVLGFSSSSGGATSFSLAGSSKQQQGEEIALSHEVMEAVNGEVSAEMLRLPNQNLFDYLKRQYSQQSSKLSDEAFIRSSWEMVRPEC